LIGQAARFYLFRRYVFRKPVNVGELVHPQTLTLPAHRMAGPGSGSEDWVGPS
jgi:hypothetical protein